ncbi:MAG: lipid A deacylase LpxR family protein [Alphaproteobacteria bacterium]|nr:lipid A deacylase LpxR family protein [Alphaproteobacteria bacterium]
MMKRIQNILYLLFMALSSQAFAEDIRKDADDKGIFNIVIENDVFVGADHDYTNGIRFAWLSSEKNMPNWVQSVASVLPIAGEGHKRVNIAAGQNMFTPNNISATQPMNGDHPYAGWLYGSVGIVSDTGKTMDNVMLTLGVVGPYSLAAEAQGFFHDTIGGIHPNGWGNQLKNEPGVILTYERKWRSMVEFSPFGLAADITPHGGINLGNINTDASLGGTFRLGYDLPADYGPPRIRPSLPGSDFFIPTKELGGYLFTTVEGRAVARNIFLDGNSFSDGPHVDKELLVASAQLGAAITYGESRLSYTHVFMTKEYTTQNRGSQFGSLSFSHRF